MRARHRTAEYREREAKEREAIRVEFPPDVQQQLVESVRNQGIELRRIRNECPSARETAAGKITVAEAESLGADIKDDNRLSVLKAKAILASTSSHPTG